MVTFHGTNEQRSITESGIKGFMVADLLLRPADEMEGRGTF